MPTIKRVPKTSDIIAFLLILFFFISGFLTLPLYGLTFDEGLGNLFFGQRYLYYFLTRDPAYIDFSNANLHIHNRSINLFLSPLRLAPQEFPPFADTLSAGTMELFGYKLGIMDPIDGFHLFTIILSTILLIIVYLFCRRYLDSFTAVLAIVFLGTYPRIWGDMHINVKDISQTAFYSFTLITFFIWYKRPSVLKAVGAGLLLGSALATKANAMFIPATLMLGVWPWQAKKYPWSLLLKHLRATYKYYIMMGLSMVSLYFLSWPYLYADPTRVQNYFRYIFSQGGRQGEMQINWDPLIQAFSTMPETTFIFLVLGVVFILLNRNALEKTIPRFLLIWLLFPLFRSSLPGTVNFDGIRHFSEFVPAACILAAYGSVSLVNFLSQKLHIASRIVAIPILALIFINILFINSKYFPFQNVYFNTFVGGLSGAHSDLGFPEATDYWASSYRQGMQWLNENADENARLYTPFAPWLVDITEDAWLREDIQPVTEEYFQQEAGQEPVYIMFVTRTNWYNHISRYTDENFMPVHEIVIDGTPILKIFRLTTLPDEFTLD